MDFVSPKEWGAMKDYDSWQSGHWSPDKWVVHYGGGPNYAGDPAKASEKGFEFPSREAEMQVLRSWERWHVNGRGWRGIAYNYAIGQSGTAYRLRGERQAAATKGDYEPDGIPENYEARAVVFILGGDQKPTEDALDTFRRMYREFGDVELVIVHSDVRDTQCPGDWLRKWVKVDKGFLNKGDVMWVKKGDTGFDVEFWQQLLNIADPSLQLQEDGVFGDATEAAVRKVTNRYVSGIGPTEGRIVLFKAIDAGLRMEDFNVLNGKVDSLIERVFSVEKKLEAVKEVL